MPSKVPQIEIPKTDIWSALFERKERPFPDSQGTLHIFLSILPHHCFYKTSTNYLTPKVIYQCPLTGRNYTYSSLRRTTILFGSALRKKWTFKKGDVLALFAQNCIDTPAVTWGTHWAGGVVSPANPAYTVRELAHHLRDSGAKALFTQRHLLANAVKAAREADIPTERILLIGEERDTVFLHLQDFLAGVEQTGERERLDCERDLAFLVYSSGTTGLPKGVMLSHLNVVSDLFMVNSSEGTLLNWKRDKVLSVLPYYHIYGMSRLPFPHTLRRGVACK
jgi:4-coumarate--CoA ligase